jgi:SpoVK/Ycf46/Vps4 family AAA+-type ATPase
VDFLTLNTGQKFELPFMVLVSFATNIRPQELVDEAFLRRIHYKVLCESPSPDDFTLIFRNYCTQVNVPFDRDLVHDLLENYYAPRGIPLRGCHPRDLIDQSLSLAEYLGQLRALTPELLRAACDSYFVDDSEAASSSPAPHA